jgi:hypothetical protein
MFSIMFKLRTTNDLNIMSLTMHLQEIGYLTIYEISTGNTVYLVVQEKSSKK